MRKIGIVLALLLAGIAPVCAQSTNVTTTVEFHLRTFAGGAQGRFLTLSPVNNPLTDGTNTYWGQKLKVYPTNGLVSVPLVPNSYTVQMDGVEGSFTINVFPTNVVMNAASLSTNLLSYAYPGTGDGSGWTNLNASALASGTVPMARLPAGLVGTNSFAVVAGANVTVTTNGGAFTVSATASGGGITNNQSLVTLQNLTVPWSLTLPAPWASGEGSLLVRAADGTVLTTTATNDAVGALHINNDLFVAGGIYGTFVGTNIAAGTVSSNALDSATKAQLALAGTGGGGSNYSAGNGLTLSNNVFAVSPTQSLISVTATVFSASSLVGTFDGTTNIRPGSITEAAIAPSDWAKMTNGGGGSNSFDATASYTFSGESNRFTKPVVFDPYPGYGAIVAGTNFMDHWSNSIVMPPFGHVGWGQGCGIYEWPNHSGAGKPEIIMESPYGLALFISGMGNVQFGGSKATHETFRLQYDDDPYMADGGYAYAGTYTNGHSKALSFVARVGRVEAGSTNVYQSGATIMGWGAGTNTTPLNDSRYGDGANVAFGELAFYTVPPSWSEAGTNGGPPSYAGVEVGRMRTNGWTLNGSNVVNGSVTVSNGILLPAMAAPAPVAGAGWLWNSNQMLYWVTVGSTSLLATGSSPCVGASISVNPVAVTCITNTTTNFTVTAAGTTPLTYQWRTNAVALVDGTHWAGSSTATLWVSNTVIGDSNTLISCYVTNACGAVTSAVVALAVTNGVGGGGACISANTTNAWDNLLEGFQTATTGYESNIWSVTGTATNVNPAFDTSGLSAQKPDGACSQALRIVEPTGGVDTYIRGDLGAANVIDLDTVQTTVTMGFLLETNVSGINSITTMFGLNADGGFGAFTGIQIETSAFPNPQLRASGASNSTWIDIATNQWYTIVLKLDTAQAAGGSSMEIWAGGSQVTGSPQTFQRSAIDLRYLFIGAYDNYDAGEQYIGIWDLISIKTY